MNAALNNLPTTTATTREKLREQMKRSQSAFTGQLCNGFFYDEELSGSEGAHFTLFVPIGTPTEEVDKAKREIKNHYDCMGFTVIGIPADLAAELTHKADKQPAGGWIESVRWIVENKQCRAIDAMGAFIPKGKAGGQTCDLYTASIMAQIYDKLNDKNREKFHKMSFAVAHHVAMKLV